MSFYAWMLDINYIGPRCSKKVFKLKTKNTKCKEID